MIFKKIKPVTSSLRHYFNIQNYFLKNIYIFKPLIKGKKNSSGRNNSGKITVYHKGNGHKKCYRKIQFHGNCDYTGIVMSIEYDPNRTANISLIYDYIKIKYFYIISPKYLKVGDIIKIGLKSQIKLGHFISLDKIPTGSFVYNITDKLNEKSKYTKAAGTYSYIIEKNKDYALIKLSSGKYKKFSLKCFAMLGIVSNEENFLISLGKAGRSRWLNKRPTVRGVAMNPIDHPHGGGEGKTSGGRTSVTPWGKPCKS